jgi:hypothetical protein
MDSRKLVRLARILALLGSDHPGERASAAYAADRMVASLGTTWLDLLRPTPAPSRPTSYGVDERAAAEARMRQLRANNERLEKQVRSLRRRLAAKQDAERRRRMAADEVENRPG